MFQYKDTTVRAWLALIRPIAIIFLLIGECTAQDIYSDLIGMKRKHIQVLMKNESYVDYQKSHVTYRLSPAVKQTVLYDADTCKAYFWSVALSESESFENGLQQEGLASLSYRKTVSAGETDSVMLFLVEKKVEGALVPGQSKEPDEAASEKASAKQERSNANTSVKFSAAQLPPKEERLRPNWDTVESVKVFGWKVDK